MRGICRRIAATGLLALALTGAGTGVAAASPAVWLVPGVDAGPLLGPAIGLPTQLLAPVDGLLTALEPR
ncbi:hypothetical protein [Saccharopolyspora rosea]|uniref:Uncharacterized protein n=1 Tax=Saccharopolyspora rosea TaxID=524884 RepID=A0ABW3FW07_9PSEU|nr:hypothetical protein [Saccharopolyspora rosea]